MEQITLICPDDWHCHFRDGDYLTRTVQDSARCFQRAVVMPNLKPPVFTVAEAMSYRQRILQHLPAGSDFTPLMTLYLSEKTAEADLREAASNPHIIGCKLYPAGVTTNSTQGVTKVAAIYPLLEIMEEAGLPLLVHGENNDAQTDVFDREARFIEEELVEILKRFPKLRVVLEHISTQKAVEFVQAAPSQLAATITAHHLLLNRNDLLDEGIRPHYYCKPILKRQKDQEALIQAAISGNPKFFLGTDSAPHSIQNKESACGCAGVYTAHAAIEFYASVFEQHKALDTLENFASVYGAHFYGLAVNTRKITLQKEEWKVPGTLDFGKETLAPFMAGESLYWKLNRDT